MNQEDELKNTFLEEYSAAYLLKKAGKLKSSVILLSKALFALCDYIILKKYSKLPKNHSERFRILELKEKKVFLEVDSAWSKYTDTYSKPSNEDAFRMLDSSVRKIIQNEETCSEIKRLIEK